MCVRMPVRETVILYLCVSESEREFVAVERWFASSLFTDRADFELDFDQKLLGQLRKLKNFICLTLDKPFTPIA